MATLSRAAGTPAEGAETTCGLADRPDGRTTQVPLITGWSIPHPHARCRARVKR